MLMNHHVNHYQSQKQTFLAQASAEKKQKSDINHHALSIMVSLLVLVVSVERCRRQLAGECPTRLGKGRLMGRHRP